MNDEYKCGECQNEKGLTKTISIFRFPKVLVINLKRFYKVKNQNRREKLNTNVSLP